MVNLLTGPKGSGKTQQMIELANKAAKESDGHVFFIKKSHRDTYSLSFDIRAICMDDYDAIDNIDAYLGFIYGMTSADHDIKAIFIDAILKHAHISIDDIPEFVEKLKKISKECDLDFYVSISAAKEDLKLTNTEDCAYLN
nr:hypothetical protein [uncultured Sellimonas sp.]